AQHMEKFVKQIKANRMELNGSNGFIENPNNNSTTHEEHIFLFNGTKIKVSPMWEKNIQKQKKIKKKTSGLSNKMVKYISSRKTKGVEFFKAQKLLESEAAIKKVLEKKNEYQKSTPQRLKNQVDNIVKGVELP